MTPQGFRDARAALNLTQRQLAALMGVHHMTISKIERGAIPIVPVMALALECLLGRGKIRTRLARNLERQHTQS